MLNLGKKHNRRIGARKDRQMLDFSPITLTEMYCGEIELAKKKIS